MHNQQMKTLGSSIDAPGALRFERRSEVVDPHREPGTGDLRVNRSSPPGSGPGVAGTVGGDIFVPAIGIAPGSMAEQAILAHESAHVMQQRRGAATGQADSDSLLEREANAFAVRSVLSPGDPPIAVRGFSPLKLQRCSFEKAPENLDSLSTEDKAAYVRRAISDNDHGVSKAVYTVFEQARSAGDFVALQERLDMDDVFDTVDRWHALRIGALGPIIGGNDRLNGLRSDFIWEMTDDIGAQRAEVFAKWIFDSTQSDQITAVLRNLASDKHLSKTVGRMPNVRGALEARGVDVAAITDRGFKASDIARGAWGVVSDFFGSSPLAQNNRGMANYGMVNDLPPAYRDEIWSIDAGIQEQAMSPGNLAFGMVDYLSFGTVSSVRGLVTGTASGLRNLAKGEYEDAVHDLLPALLIVGTLAARRAIKVRADKVVAAEAAMAKAATLESTLARLEPASAAALQDLVGEFGEAGIKKAAGYLERDSAAAALAERYKAPGIRALLDAEGDVAKAEGLLRDRVQAARLPSGKLVGPDHYGTVYHGTADIPPERAFKDGLPGRGGNVDLESHVAQKGDTAFRGSSNLPLTPDGEGGPGHWAGAGGWVYKIEGMPAWDVTKQLEGRRPVGGGFAGTLMPGEAEMAIPARVPAARIVSAYSIVEGIGGKLKLGTELPNPNYKPGP